jgi:hypothetical protein
MNASHLGISKKLAKFIFAFDLQTFACKIRQRQTFFADFKNQI